MRHDDRQRGVNTGATEPEEGLRVAWNEGPDEFEFPVFDEGADAAGSPPAGRGSGPGRPPRRARGVLPAVALIVLLAAGIAIGGIPESAPSGNPSPTGSPAPACVPVATSAVPTFEVRAAGSEFGFAGVVGYTHRPGFETPDEGWQVPDPEPGRSAPEVASGASVEVYAAAGTCFWFIVAEYADATLGHVPDQAERRPLLAAAVEPPSPNPGLGRLPDGDWVVRVSAYFETSVSGPEGLVIAESYFRVRVGSGPLPTPTPEPTPLVTPAVPCGPAPASPDDVELVLSAPGSEAIAGVPDGTAAPVAEIPVGERGGIAVTGDACARSWTIEVLDADTGERLYRDAVLNSNDDPGWISQNQWRIRPVTGSYDVVVSLHFGPGVDVVRVWRIIGRGFTVPDTFLEAANGSRVRAVPGCGLTFTLVNGYSDDNPCGLGGGWGAQPAGVARDELALLRVPAWSRVTLEIPGWTITSWNGACGQIEADPSGAEFFNAPECMLGGYFVDETDSPPAAAQFLARPGEFVVQLAVTAHGSGGRYDVRMYARVAGR